ncbi:MAG: hypothetical protein WCD18_12785 [Thermosynechococcaceae cyanobacterium]
MYPQPREYGVRLMKEMVQRPFTDETLPSKAIALKVRVAHKASSLQRSRNVEQWKQPASIAKQALLICR